MITRFQNVLAIDTATRKLHLAVLFGGDRSVKLTEVVPKTHGQILMKKIDDLFSSAGLHVGDLQALVVSLGPGSFTGLRIGLAAAKGIAVGRGIPIVGVTLFEVAALCLPRIERRVHVLIPSRKGEFYLGTLGNGAIGEKDISVVGESVLPERVGSEEVFTIEYDHRTVEATQSLNAQRLEYDAGDVLQAGLKKLQNGEISDLASLEPVYLQKAIAEIRFDQRRRDQ